MPKDLTAAWTFDGRWNPLTGAVRPAALVPASQIDTTAEKMLLYQRALGGWPKALGEAKVNFAARLSLGARAGLLDGTWPAALLAVEYPAWQKRVGGEAPK